MDLPALPPRRRSPLRLRGFDYAQPGAYFVTVCAHRGETLFGVVVDGVMRLSAEGEIVEETWLRLPDHYSNVEIDSCGVMPNHVHGVVILCGRVGAGFKPAPTSCEESLPVEAVGRHHSLSEIVRGFKTFSARGINNLRGRRGAPVWQRGFYEHVLRDEEDLDRVRRYIEANPIRWAGDEENPNCVVP
jgi:putative transposase